MNVIEFIGFIFTFLALSFLFGRQAYEEKKRKRDPEKYEKEKEERERRIREYYSQLLGEEEEEEVESIEELEEELVTPTLQNSLLDQPILLPKETPVLAEDLVIRQRQTAFASKLKNLKDKRDLLIFSTLFGPPKSLSKNQHPWDSL